MSADAVDQERARRRGPARCRHVLHLDVAAAHAAHVRRVVPGRVRDATASTTCCDAEADADASHARRTGRWPGRAARAVAIGSRRGARRRRRSLIATPWNLRCGGASALPRGSTAAYSLGLKHQAVIELGIVASGFLLRAVAGGPATGIPLSQWFLIVAAFGSLFMVAGKRLSELVALDGAHPREPADAGELHRVVPADGRRRQRVRDHRGLLPVGLRGRRGHDEGVPWAAVSVAPLVIAMLRYALDVDRGRAQEPEQIVLRDRVLQVLGAALAGHLRPDRADLSRCADPPPGRLATSSTAGVGPRRPRRRRPARRCERGGRRGSGCRAARGAGARAGPVATATPRRTPAGPCSTCRTWTRSGRSTRPPVRSLRRRGVRRRAAAAHAPRGLVRAGHARDAAGQPRRRGGRRRARQEPPPRRQHRGAHRAAAGRRRAGRGAGRDAGGPGVRATCSAASAWPLWSPRCGCGCGR